MSPSTSTSGAEPSPSTEPSDRSGNAWLSRVQALLAKAERTEFPEEAEALLAKAQDLMARHAITQAMIHHDAARRGDRAESVTSWRLVVEAPYATAKRTLLGAVASANSCRTVYLGSQDQGRPCMVFGHPSDLANVETLFASLSLQAVRAMLAAPVPAGDTPRRFRHAFLLAYANRVGQRLYAAGEAARTQVTSSPEHGSQVAVVLADRSRAVDTALAEAFPRTRTARSTATSRAGWQSGHSAANRAGLGQRNLGSARPALGS